MGMIGILKAKEGKVISPSSIVPNKSMTTLQLGQKMEIAQEERGGLKRKNVEKEETIAALLKEESVVLDTITKTVL